MRQLGVILLLLVCQLTFAADDSGAFTLQEPLRYSKAIPGFVTLVSDSAVWEVDAKQMISVYRAKAKPDQTTLAIAVPLVTGRTHTQVVIPEMVMKYENVLRFVQGLRFTPEK